MNENDKRALSLALPRLVSGLKLTPRFKAGLLSANIFPEDFLDAQFEGEDQGEALFRIIQRLKKLDHADTFDQFLEILVKAGEEEIAAYLRDLREKSKESQTFQTSSVDTNPGNPAKLTSKENLRSGNTDSSSLRSPGPSQASYSRFPFVEPKDRKSEGTKHNTADTSSDQTQHQSANGPKSRSSLSEPELRKALKESHRFFVKGEPQLGDVILNKSYTSDVRRFQQGLTDTRPGQLEGPDVTKTAIPNSQVGAVDPAYSAALSKLLGGVPQLFYGKESGVPAFLGLDGKIKFIAASFSVRPSGVRSDVQPPGVRSEPAWLAYEAKVEDCVACTLGFYPKKMCQHNKPEKVISRTDTVHEWFRKAKQIVIDVWN